MDCVRDDFDFSLYKSCIITIHTFVINTNKTEMYYFVNAYINYITYLITVNVFNSVNELLKRDFK